MDIQEEREAFEAWFESRYNAHFMQFALDLDFYVDKHTRTCWEAWQAKANAVPEGFVLVPKEPTQEMIEAGMGNFDFPLDNGRFSNHDLIFAYRAMLAASQEPAND